jgi:hypothetical protein
LNRMRICFSSCFGSLDALVTAPFSMKSEGRESCWTSEALQEVIIHKEKEGSLEGVVVVFQWMWAASRRQVTKTAVKCRSLPSHPKFYGFHVATVSYAPRPLRSAHIIYQSRHGLST